MSDFPNLEPKRIGEYVRHIHPCGRAGYGTVAMIDPQMGTVTVVPETSSGGSTIYGPVENWQPLGYCRIDLPLFDAKYNRV